MFHLALGSPLSGGYKRRHQSVTSSVYKKEDPDTLFYKLISYLKILLNSPFERSILVEAEN